MNKKILFILVAVAAVTLSGQSLVNASHNWSKYHWNISTEQSQASPLKLGNNLTTAAWKSSLNLASSEWNQSVLKNQVVSGSSNASCSPTLGQVEVCNDTYGNNGWLGIAQVWAYRGKDGHIAQAVVKLNDSYFNTSAYNTTAWRNLVTCQEVGHTFGLGHQDENFSNSNLGTCMDYTNDPDGTLYGQLNNERPNAHDYEMLSNIYAHLNSGDTGNPGNGKGNGGGKKGRADIPAVALDRPSQWGKAIKKDAQGKNSLYERDLGNGFVVLTHVTWVE
jgi:hypothetical protein